MAKGLVLLLCLGIFWSSLNATHGKFLFLSVSVVTKNILLVSLKRYQGKTNFLAITGYEIDAVKKLKCRGYFAGHHLGLR